MDQIGVEWCVPVIANCYTKKHFIETFQSTILCISKVVWSKVEGLYLFYIAVWVLQERRITTRDTLL